MKIGSYNKEDYIDKGLTGLQNLGNTCFLNSTIQCLSHIYELNTFLEEEEYKKMLNRKAESILLIEWDKLRGLMWSENCTISPAGFVQSVQKVAKLKDKDIFTGWAQNDLPEFLLFLIESFHEALEREVDMVIRGKVLNEKDKLAKECFIMMKDMYNKEYSEILKIFYGIHVSQLKSLSGNVLSRKPEPYFMIDLPIPENVSGITTIHDCFKLYLENERLEGDNAWLNDKTDTKEDVDKSLIFWSFPSILVICFKRFDNNSRKNQKPIYFELDNLNLSEYVDGYDKQLYIYDVFGICNHSGGTQGGHYTATVRGANNKWYNYNDMEIKEVRDNNILTNQAYCIFLRKKT